MLGDRRVGGPLAWRSSRGHEIGVPMQALMRPPAQHDGLSRIRSSRLPIVLRDTPRCSAISSWVMSSTNRRDQDLDVRLVELLRERGDQRDADDLVVHPHASHRRRCGVLALEQPRTRAAIAKEIAAAIRDRFIEVGKVHG